MSDDVIDAVPEPPVTPATVLLGTNQRDANPEIGLSVQQLDAIAVELADVEEALGRLDASQYWTDEVSGRPLDEQFLIEHPLARSQPHV